MFDSPFALCKRHNEMVLVDQTLVECAREHACDDTCTCPLARYFPDADNAAPTAHEDAHDPAH